MRVRNALLALGLAPVLALGPASPAAASSTACNGIAPVTRSCQASGTVGSTMEVRTGPNLGYTGTVTMTVSSETSLYTWSVTFEAGYPSSVGSPSQSGVFVPGQAYTLRGTADGVGHWSVAVLSP